MRLFCCFLLALSPAACGSSHDAGDDAAITFDAAFPDAGPPDSGPPPTTVGAGCTADTDCAGSMSYCAPQLPGGFCTRDCTSDTDCGGGAVCVLTDRQTGASSCFPTCTPGSTPRSCRQFYGCAEAPEIAAAPFCLPGCIDNTDCPMGLVCDPMGGQAGEGACYDPDARIGDACMDEPDCPSGAFCRGSWPGGACVYFGCDYEGNTDCPSGSVCVASTGRFSSSLCAASCTMDSDCRSGYRCSPDVGFPTRRFCNPVLAADRVGQACSGGGGGASCTGGVCLTEVASGFPGSYCVDVGCNVADNTGCPGDGVCIAAVSGIGLCIDGCMGPLDCRSGYICRPSDSANLGSPPACLPGCTSSAQCANMGFVCNVGTGRCTEAFDTAALGRACTSGAECTGGSCLTTGWPGGMCVYPGCGLATNPGAPCPANSVCVDDGGGDPTLGVCVPSCMVGGTTCRMGYTCQATGGSTTDGGCVPMP